MPTQKRGETVLEPRYTLQQVTGLGWAHRCLRFQVHLENIHSVHRPIDAR